MGTLTTFQVGVYFKNGKKWGGTIIDRRSIAEDDTIVAATTFVIRNRLGLSFLALEGDVPLKVGDKIELIDMIGEEWETRVPVIVMNGKGEFVFERDIHKIRPFSFVTFGNPYQCDGERCHDPAHWFTISLAARRTYVGANFSWEEEYKTHGLGFYNMWTPDVFYASPAYWEAAAKQGVSKLK